MEIKPCPFCGRQPEITQDKWGGWIAVCDGESHNVTCGSFMAKEQAIEEWNKRAV
ncbi:MAG: hypothetical protein EOM15_12895 [Spirochaetia bacterium]|nr:hypothetical protein [Spirochaetia bacterium]